MFKDIHVIASDTLVAKEDAFTVVNLFIGTAYLF